tara:strand:+ start:513 stop:731 length:219 start_codon:yes stop_codon:yes gene_type:complete
MNNSLVNFKQLQELTGLSRSGAIKRHLNLNGIRFFGHKGTNIYTTVELINSAGGLVYSVNEEVQPEQIILDP